jgi:hypothetical protein
MVNTALTLTLSPEFKAAIEEAAHTAERVDASTWARKVLAESIGYDLSQDSGVDGRGRPKKYATVAERNKAHADAARARKARADAIVAAVMKQEKLADIGALESWLQARGIMSMD